MSVDSTMNDTHVQAANLNPMIAREVVTAAIINAVIASAISYATLPTEAPLLGGDGSVLFGLIAVGVLFPLLGTLVIWTIATRKLANHPPSAADPLFARIRLLPKNRLLAAALQAAFCAGVVAPLAALLLAQFSPAIWPRMGIWVMNVVFIEFLTLLVVPAAFLGGAREVSAT